VRGYKLSGLGLTLEAISSLHTELFLANDSLQARISWKDEHLHHILHLSASSTARSRHPRFPRPTTHTCSTWNFGPGNGSPTATNVVVVVVVVVGVLVVVIRFSKL